VALGVLDQVDASYSAHVLGAPKEDARFWRALRQLECFQPARSLFVDDSAAVLRAAGAAGVGFIRAIRRPGSAGVGHLHEEFCAVDALVELLAPK